MSNPIQAIRGTGAPHLSNAYGQFAYFDAQLGHPDWRGKTVLDFGGNQGNLLETPGCPIDERDYWSHFYLGFHHDRVGHLQRALEHYQAAVVLRPDSPWAWNNLALLHYKRDDWRQALDDANRALSSARAFDFLEARLTLGQAKMALGDEKGARTAFD